MSVRNLRRRTEDLSFSYAESRLIPSELSAVASKQECREFLDLVIRVRAERWGFGGASARRIFFSRMALKYQNFDASNLRIIGGLLSAERLRQVAAGDLSSLLWQDDTGRGLAHTCNQSVLNHRLPLQALAASP